MYPEGGEASGNYSSTQLTPEHAYEDLSEKLKKMRGKK